MKKLFIALFCMTLISGCGCKTTLTIERITTRNDGFKCNYFLDGDDGCYFIDSCNKYHVGDKLK
jgi:hypothetical protein